jgi:thiol:disulfide interchange protein
LAAVAAAAAITLGAVALVPAPAIVSGRVPAGAKSWSEQRVAASLSDGKPVFVYFTADWCLTCKVNETAAIDRKDVRRAFDRADVQVLAGDWTNGDPAITRFLESRGRAGVPLYLWYEPGREPEELPQIVTAGMLISRARQATAGK